MFALGGCGDSSPDRTVSVLGPWTGREEQSFLEVLAPFERDTGMRVGYEGTRDLAAVLASRVQDGNPPDLVVLPSPDQLRTYAPHMAALGPVVDEQLMTSQYGNSWQGLGLVDGRRYAVVVKVAVKNLVWYVPTAGYQPPATWDEMVALSQQMLTTGTTPWCIGLRDSSASGWPGTDWIEAIVLRQSGPSAYDKWARGQLKWTSPEIRQAFETWKQILGVPHMVYGGERAMLLTSFAEAGRPLFTDPPGCFFDQEASFIANSYAGYESEHPLTPGTDFSYAPFPQIDPTFSDVQEIAADLLGMFHDTPSARQLVRYLTTKNAQRIGVESGDWISPNQQVSLTSYPDTESWQIGMMIGESRKVCFDASDLMPDAVRTAFYHAVLAFVADPQRLDDILATLDKVQETASTDTQRSPAACA